MQVKRLVFSDHARHQMVERRVNTATVERVLESPDAVLPAKKGRQVAQKLLRAGGGSFLYRRLRMKIWYDEKADAMYIRFSPAKYHVSRQINDSLILDLDRRGRILGLEILDASETLPGGTVSHLDFEVRHPEQHVHR